MNKTDAITALKSLTDKASQVSGLPDNVVIHSIAAEIAGVRRALTIDCGGFWYA